MKWEINRRTGIMEPVKKRGVEVTARMGGIMVEDTERNIRFLINYGNRGISHCTGCRETNLHLFNDMDARKIADSVKRLGNGRGIPEKYYDWRMYSAANRNFNGAEVDESENHTNKEQYKQYDMNIYTFDEFVQHTGGTANALKESYIQDSEKNAKSEKERKKMERFAHKFINALKQKSKLDTYVKAINSILDGSGVVDKDNTALYLKTIAEIFSGAKKNDSNLYETYECEGEKDIPVKDLYPTQTEIDIENSAKWATKDWGAEGVDNMFGNKGFGSTFAVPVLVYYDGKKYWIIDGHHRWSQVALINPEAKLHCLVIKGKESVQDFLKLTQSVIAGVIAERGNGETLPVGKANPDNNIFGNALKGEKLKNRITKMLGDNKKVADILFDKLGKHSEELGDEKNAEYNVDKVADMVMNNRDLMVERGQEPDLKWAAPRQFMPQSDKAGKRGEKDSGVNDKDSALNKMKNIKNLPDIN